MFNGILYIILYSVFNVTGAAIIKWQLKGKTLGTVDEWIRFLVAPSFVIAFTFIILSALALFKALASSNFSFTIPLATGINFILTVAVGYYIFQDKLSVLSYAGFLLIIGGIIVLSLNNQIHA